MSHLAQLPPEIYTEIFIMARGSRGDLLRDDPHWRKPDIMTPFTLGAVCRHWRNIILSAPKIWSEIYLHLHSTRIDEHVAYLGHCLTRSKPHPLTITLAFENENRTGPDGWWDVISGPSFSLGLLVTLLLSSSNRWQRIDMTLPECWYNVFAMEGHNFPNLVSMRVRPLWDDIFQPKSERKVFDLLHHSPSLRELHVRSIFIWHAKIPWTQLQRLTVKDEALNTCRYALAEAQNLVWCRLIGPWISSDAQAPKTEKPVVLRSLQTLVLEEHVFVPERVYSLLEALLHDLSYPALETLEISISIIPKDLPTWLSNGGARLTYLVVRDFLKDTEGLLHCLREMHLLEKFDLDVHRGWHIRGSLLKTIFVKPHPPKSTNYTLPNLRCFSFSGKIALKNSNLDRLLLNIFQFRAPAAVHNEVGPRTMRLLSFDLETGGYFSPSPDVKREMEVLTKGGLQLRVMCGGVSWI